MKINFSALILAAIVAATQLGFSPSGKSYLPPPDDRVGGIDFDKYCRSIGATHHGIDTSRGRDGVYCQFDSGGSIQWLSKSDIDRACRNQYGSNAYADHDGSNHPYAWFCAAPPPQQSASNNQPSTSSSSNQQSQNQSQQSQSPSSSSNSTTTTTSCSGYTKNFLSGSSSVPSGKYLTTGYDKVLLRSAPGQDKCSYGWLTKGQYYPVLNQSGGWIKTRAGGIEGWVMAAYVTTGEGSSSSNSQSQTYPSPGPAPKASPCFYGKGIVKEWKDGEWHHYVWFQVGDININSWKVNSPSWIPTKYKAQLWAGAEDGIAKAGFGWLDWFPTTIPASSFSLCPQ